jgi:hypothetical protein
MQHLKGVTNGFELPRTHPQYPQSLTFRIDYTSLTIKPELKSEDKNLIKFREVVKQGKTIGYVII